jgi:hypothetical protein
MKQLPASFVVVMAFALWLVSAAAVSAAEYTKDGRITNVDPKTMTFTLECSDPTQKWPNLSVANPELFKSLNTKDKYTVIFDHMGDRNDPKNSRGVVKSIMKKN